MQIVHIGESGKEFDIESVTIPKDHEFYSVLLAIESAACGKEEKR